MKPTYFLLNNGARQAPVSLLRLGDLAEILESTGFLCVGDLLKPVQGKRDSSAWICGLDAADAKLLSDRVHLLRAHVDTRGNVGWAEYHAACGDHALAKLEPAAPAPPVEPEPWGTPTSDESSLVPSFEVASGADFIRAFPEVIQSIVRSRDNEADRTILVERLTKQPGDRMTLDQIASSLANRITRERVRQREAKILRLLANALLHGRQRSLGVQFRPSFTGYWRAAAEQFGDQTKITFSQFLDGLEAAWSVPAEQLFDHLSFITSVLTRSATIPAQLRVQMRRDRRLFQELVAPDRDTPVTRLPLGKAVDSLLANGIATVGDMFDAARNGVGPDPRSSAGLVVERVLSALAEALGEDGRIDWPRYESHLGLQRLPTVDPISVDSFLATLACDLDAILRANAYTLRAAEIFRLRIAVVPSQRATLAQAAERLGSHGPSIKREESVLLSRLNDLLVEGDLTRSSVSISPAYLSYWTDVATVYRQCGGDFERFCLLAVDRWSVSPDQLAERAQILWAVLNEYPAGRPSRTNRPRPQPQPATPAAPIGAVVLRGFQRVH